jgi:sulfotransferase
MKKKMFYNSSLPRAGSTLVSNILGQNPNIYVSPTSGLLELVFAARANYSDSPEFKAQESELMKKAFLSFCKEGMDGYYDSITDKEIVIDKSRGWGIHFGFLTQIRGEKPKIICMVRDLREIICSMEKNFRKNQDKHDKIVSHSEMRGTSTPKRVDVWLNSQPVGLALERLNEMIRQGIDKDILFIRFEDLCKNPKDEMKKIYEYLGIEYYEHDFNNVEQITVEDDEVYGIYGDHKIRLKVEPVPITHNTILGSDVSNWVFQNYKWYFDYFKYNV